MKGQLAVAAGLLVGGIYLSRAGRQATRPPIPPGPPAWLVREKWLNSPLQAAGGDGDRRRWDALSEECRRIGRPNMPGNVLRKFPHLEERLNRT